MTRLILSVLYFLIVTPIGLLYRLVGRSELELDFRTGASSYWRMKKNFHGSRLPETALRPKLFLINQMNQDTEHLGLLAIFHYVVAGLTALFSFFPLLYAAVGTIFIFVARHGSPKPGEELPPEFLGWIFAVIGSLLFLLGIAIAICVLIAGCSLAKHRHYWFAFAIACVECLFIPFGTILGVFTIIVLSREPVKALFGATQT